MLDKYLINQKLASISLYLKEIEPILGLPYKDFYKNYRDIRTAERDFQLIVDAAVDINTHLILEKGQKPPDTNFESFLMISDYRALPESVLETLAKSAGLRNKLVHEYEKIDPYILYKSLKKFYPLYVRYRKAVYSLVGRNSWK